MVRFAGIPYTQPAAAAGPAGLTVSNRRFIDLHPGPDRQRHRDGQLTEGLDGWGLGGSILITVAMVLLLALVITL